LETDLNVEFSPLNVEIRYDKQSNTPVAIYMNMGLAQNFTKNNIVEFLIEEAGLSHGDVRNIVVEENRSHFEVPEKFRQQVFLNLKGFKLFHRNLKLTLDGENSKRNIY